MADKAPAKAETLQFNTADVVEKLRSPQFIIFTVLWIVVTIILAVLEVDNLWHILTLITWLLIGPCNIATNAKTFFKADIDDKATDSSSMFVLGSSAMMSWVFAKSINNASVLSAKYGIVGGFGYCAWYLSFVGSSVVIYRLRLKGYFSLPHMIFDRYGRWAQLLYCIANFYRLYTEVWSNTMTVSDFYGSRVESDTDYDRDWWTSNLLGLSIPLAYVFMGGMKSSIVSDAVQGTFTIAFLFVVLIAMTAMKDDNKYLNKHLEDNYVGSSWELYNPVPSRAMLSLDGGMDLLAGGAVQGLLSYPFFDPVLTDRAFLTDPRTMARSFMIGGTFAGFIILCFGFLGIYGSMLGNCVNDGVCPESDLNGAVLADVKAGKPFAVAKTMGDTILFLTAFIMILSSISTLDSTFTSTAKLLGPDMSGLWGWLYDIVTGKVSIRASTRGESIQKYMPLSMAQATDRHVWVGRLGMIFMAFIGTLPIIECPTQLSATTISGTVVMGLGAPIYMIGILPDSWLWTRGTKRPLAFCTSFIFCAMMGICYQVRYSTKDCEGNLKYPYVNVDFTPLTIGGGSYGMFLGTNVAGAMVSLVCWALFAKLDFCLFNEIPTLAEVKAAAAAKVKIYVTDDQGAVSLIDGPGSAVESPASAGEIELLVSGSAL